jgi:hypothetical protein
VAANYYEHIVRKNESLQTIAEYIANNPVRRNLVTQWQDYPFVGFITTHFHKMCA